MFQGNCPCCGASLIPCSICSNALPPGGAVAIDAAVSITNSAGARVANVFNYCAEPLTACTGFSAWPSYIVCNVPNYTFPGCSSIIECRYKYFNTICGPYDSFNRVGGPVHYVLAILQNLGLGNKRWDVTLYAGDAYSPPYGPSACSFQGNNGSWCSGDPGPGAFTNPTITYSSSNFTSCTPAASYTCTTSASPLTIYNPWGTVVYPSSLTLYPL